MSADRARYSVSQRRLHWLMAVLVGVGYLLIEQRGLFPRGSGGRYAMLQGHYWVGISIFVLALSRLLARRRHGAPPITPPLPRAQKMLSSLVHVSLYAFFIVMPLLGLATAWLDGKQVFIPFTQVALPALLAENRGLAHTVEDLHGAVGDVFYWVIGLHIAAALYHHFVRKDDTLARMG